MRIGAPELITTSDSATLQARVTLAHSAGAFPHRLWFKVPRRFEPLISPGFESFVVALGSLASSRGEPIEIGGPISERLAVGLEEYWSIISSWAPDRFHPVVVRSAGFADEGPRGTCAASAFSGGVDSFYTLYRGLKFGEPRPPAHQIRYALFIHGFDIPLAERETYDVAAAAYEAELHRHGIDLVRIETNLRDFIPSANWEMGHGSALGGTALTLAGGVKRFFIPSSKSYTTLEPWGSDPLIDGLMSTEGFHIIHDGARATRTEKLAALKDAPSIRRLLRTCYETRDGLRNCGKCQNCRRTMMVLASLGVLDDFETFPPVRSSLHFVNSRWETPHERLFGRQAIALAAASGRPGLAWTGRVAMATSPAKQLASRLKERSRPLRRKVQAFVGNVLGRFVRRQGTSPKQRRVATPL